MLRAFFRLFLGDEEQLRAFLANIKLLSAYDACKAFTRRSPLNVAIVHMILCVFILTVVMAFNRASDATMIVLPNSAAQLTMSAIALLFLLFTIVWFWVWVFLVWKPFLGKG